MLDAVPNSSPEVNPLPVQDIHIDKSDKPESEDTNRKRPSGSFSYTRPERSTIASLKQTEKKSYYERFKDKCKSFIRSLPGLLKDGLKTAVIINAAIYLPRLFFGKFYPFIDKFVSKVWK